MSNQKQIVTDQHFVPQFYLKRFVNPDGLLERLVLPTATILSKAKSPKAECNEAFFYATKTGIKDEVSQHVEDFWGQIEDFISPNLDEVERQITNNEQLTEHNLTMLAHLASMLWMRTPHFRKMLEHNMSNFEKQIYKLRASNPDFAKNLIETLKDKRSELTLEKAEEVREFILGGEYDITFNNAVHLQLMVSSFEGFRNLFYNAKWRFYIAKGKRRFVTSSVPCVEIFPQERKSFYGPTFYCRKHFFPLSPTIMIEAINPLLAGKRVKRKCITDEDVFDLNIQQANWSYIENEPQYSRCYAQRKQELEELVEFHYLTKAKKIIS